MSKKPEVDQKELIQKSGMEMGSAFIHKAVSCGTKEQRNSQLQMLYWMALEILGSHVFNTAMANTHQYDASLAYAEAEDIKDTLLDFSLTMKMSNEEGKVEFADFNTDSTPN